MTKPLLTYGMRQKRRFRWPTGTELEWIRQKFGHGEIGSSGWYLWIQTSNPPQPIPLTIGTMPVMFVGVGEDHREPIPQTSYPNPRVADPCPGLRWPAMKFPRKDINAAILTALQPLANVREVIYMPHWIIVELEYGDGRVYEPGSLPGIAGRTTLYHHAEAPFHRGMRNMTQARRVDPALHPPTKTGPMPQDGQNYLRNGFYLSPGCRLESGLGPPGSNSEGVNAATSAGVKLRRIDGREAITVSYHGFLTSKEVYHPFADEDKIGDVTDERPELDIGLVELTPAASGKFTNTCYFQAAIPKKLLDSSEIDQGSWFEVDGMSSGLVSLLTYGRRYMKPRGPAGHPEIDFREWK